jgi:hypothetical protein
VCEGERERVCVRERERVVYVCGSNVRQPNVFLPKDVEADSDKPRRLVAPLAAVKSFIVLAPGQTILLHTSLVLHRRYDIQHNDHLGQGTLTEGEGSVQLINILVLQTIFTFLQNRLS